VTDGPFTPDAFHGSLGYQVGSLDGAFRNTNGAGHQTRPACPCACSQRRPRGGRRWRPVRMHQAGRVAGEGARGRLHQALLAGIDAGPCAPAPAW